MPVDGVVPYDYLMSNTDPSLVKIELDIGWLATAGVDPVGLSASPRRPRDLVSLEGLQPFDRERHSAAQSLSAPGTGTVDFSAALAAMNETGVDHGFIEVDDSDDPFGDVRRGHAHLEALKGCA